MRRAVGIVRVSQLKGRDPGIASPAQQRQRIEDACGRDGLELREVFEELDVSGGSSLEKREGLSAAIAEIESGKARVVVVAYFDRLFRSLRVQADVVSRIEQAGGEVLALDFGKVSEASAAQWLSGTMMGAFAEYYRRSTGERFKAAQAAAIKRGVPPITSIPTGLRRREDGKLEPTEDAPIVAEALRMRAEGETIQAVRDYLAEQGISLSYRKTQGLLSNRLLLGEIRFGDLANTEAHKPVVDRETFERAQTVSIPRGRQSKSDFLLARLGILRCGTCGARMSAGTVWGGKRSKKRYRIYRCTPQSGCPQRMTISADIVEEKVVEAAKKRGRDIQGGASDSQRAAQAELAAERAQDDLDAAIRAFIGLEGETAARERIAELVTARDAAVEEANHLRSLGSIRMVSFELWDAFTLEERRAAIRAVIERVDIAPGRGPSRISITFRQ